MLSLVFTNLARHKARTVATAIGIAAMGEPATALRLASLALIIIGVVGLNMAGSH